MPPTATTGSHSRRQRPTRGRRCAVGLLMGQSCRLAVVWGKVVVQRGGFLLADDEEVDSELISVELAEPVAL